MRHASIRYLTCGAVALTCSCAPAALRATHGGVDDGSAASSEQAENDGGDLSRTAKGSEGAASVHPLLDDRQPEPDAALPLLTYKHLGMHLGGESNSAESKRPWLEDIERHDDKLLYCYRFVSDPEKGGSYGVDLYVTSQGGSPEVRGSRQRLGDEQFDRCMRQAFAGIDFHRPERPTVFSYSIFFDLEE